MQICIHTYILITPQKINTTISKSTSPPPLMIPLTAPMGSSSSISGVTVTLGITADDVTKVVVVEYVVIMRKRYIIIAIHNWILEKLAK